MLVAHCLWDFTLFVILYLLVCILDFACFISLVVPSSSVTCIIAAWLNFSLEYYLGDDLYPS